MLSKLYYFFISMRPKQWIKNLIIFIPLFFSKEFLNLTSVFSVFIVFIVFSLFCWATYIINDYMDLDKDKNHPKKKNRPMASWKINPKYAVIFAIILLVLLLVCSYFIWNIRLLCLLLAYFLNTMLYSFFVKKIEILDVFSIAIWFMIRGIIWAILINVEISIWLLVMLFLGALWFWFVKRYQEVKLGEKTRDNIFKYNDYFLEQTISMLTWIIIITYILYTFNSVQSKVMVITVPFVTFWMIRFLYNIFFLKRYEDWIEDIFLRDKYILFDIILFVLLVISVFIFDI